MKEKILHWLFNGKTGTSSKTIAAIAIGETSILYGFDRPHDNGDFSRCYDLVKEVPEVKQHFDKIKELCPEFGPIIDNWDKLCEAWEADKDRDHSLMPSRCYEIIKSLDAECYIAAGYEKTSYGWIRKRK